MIIDTFSFHIYYCIRYVSISCIKMMLKVEHVLTAVCMRVKVVAEHSLIFSAHVRNLEERGVVCGPLIEASFHAISSNVLGTICNQLLKFTKIGRAHV